MEYRARALVVYHQAQFKFYRLSQGQDGRGHTVSDHLENHSYMVNLTENVGGKLYSVPSLIVSMPGMRSLCGFFLQSLHEENKPDDIDDYGNPTLAKCQAIHNHTNEAYLAVYMLLSLDRSIHGNLIEDLSNSYSMVTDHYP